MVEFQDLPKRNRSKALKRSMEKAFDLVVSIRGD